MQVKLLLTAFLLLPFVAAADEPNPDLGVFQQQIAEILEANDIPGAGIALIRDGDVVWAGGIGYAALDPEQPVLPTTRFRIGSVTKMFTSLAVLKLVEEGRLSLDQSVHEIAPEVPISNPWHETHPVTVAQLLEHTAGFDDMHFRNMSTDESLPSSLLPILQRIEDELEVRWQPGLKHSYSNPGFAVAGYLVEKITGRPFHEYVQQELLTEMDMANTVWGVPADNAYAQGYTPSGALRAIAPRAILLYPAGELSSSPTEMARLVRLLLQRGAIGRTRVLGADSIQRMESAETTRAARHGFENGYGLGNYVSFRNGFRIHGHNGGLDGFMAELGYSPEHNFGYVVMINRADPGALRVLSEHAVDFISGDAAAPEPGTRDMAGTELPVGLTGCFRKTNPRNELLHGIEWLIQVSCVSRKEDRAVLRHPVLPKLTTMLPVQGSLMRESSMTWPTAVFMQDAGRVDALDWSWSYFERSSWLAVTLPWVVAIASMLLMFSTLVMFPVWAALWWKRRFRDVPALMTSAWPLLASLLFAATIVAALQLELGLLDSVNRITASVFAGGIAFALASFYGLYRVLRQWHAGIHPVAKWHTLLASLACSTVVLYLVYWHLVPLRLWAW